MNRIVIASNNAGKLREIRDILQPLGFTVVSQREAGISIEVEENGETFAENAALKARAVYEALHCPVIADDSGLLVDALDGAPGVHSHRFAGEGATDADRNAKLLEHFFSGTCEGRIGTAPAGENGFGYDPLFCVGDRTMAQMTEEEKNQVSHRANALAELARYFQEK